MEIAAPSHKGILNIVVRLCSLLSYWDWLHAPRIAESDLALLILLPLLSSAETPGLYKGRI